MNRDEWGNLCFTYKATGLNGFICNVMYARMPMYVCVCTCACIYTEIADELFAFCALFPIPS